MNSALHPTNPILDREHIDCSHSDVDKEMVGADSHLAPQPPHPEILDPGSGFLRIQLLSEFSVSIGEQLIPASTWRRRKVQSLVALLALTPGYRLHREQLMDQLWPDRPVSAAANNLYYTLHMARQALRAAGGAKDHFLIFEDGWVTLGPLTSCWVDVHAFETAAATARRRHELAAYQSAIDQYTGDLLPDNRYDDWAIARRDELQQQFLALLYEGAQLALAQRLPSVAIELLQRLVTYDPTHESAYQQLIRLTADMGQRVQALQHYHNLKNALQRELDCQPSHKSQQIYRTLAHEAPHEATTTSMTADDLARVPHDHVLPLFLTSFVGRVHEQVELQKLLMTTRLLTLMGPGGCGKTRLAVVLAEHMQAQYRDGVRYLDLVPLNDPALLPQALATALGILEQRGQALQTSIARYLQPKQLLLVLDNCEHLVSACAVMVDTLLQICPQLTILATSRQALKVNGERRWPVPPLACPDPKHVPSLNNLSAYEGLALFTERAQEVAPNFQLTARNAAAVTQICVALDGLPLALELAAACMNVLAPAQLAARLDQRFQLLTAGGRGRPARQQTLQAIITSSYDLLTPAAAQLLNRLAVFVGGWTLEAAEAIGTEGDGNADTVVQLLAQLIDQSLVVAEVTSDGVMRYRLLETIRVYAWARLHASGETVIIQQWHTAYYLAIAETAAPWLRTHDQLVWLDQLEREHDNLRAALTWSLTRQHNVPSGLRLVTALGWFWWVHNHYREGSAWLERAIAINSDAETIHYAHAYFYLALLAISTDDTQRGAAAAEQSLICYCQLDDRRGMSYAYGPLGVHRLNLGSPRDAQQCWNEGLALARAAGDDWLVATHLRHLAHIKDNLVDAVPLLAEANALAQAIGDRWLISLVLTDHASVLQHRGKYHHAVEVYTRALAVARELNNRGLVAELLLDLGDLLYHQGHIPIAIQYYDDCRTLAHTIGFEEGEAKALLRLGLHESTHGDRDNAIQQIIAGMQLAQRIGNHDVIAQGLACLALSTDEPERRAQLWSKAGVVLGTNEALSDHFRQQLVAGLNRVVGKQAVATTTHPALFDLEQMLAIAITFPL